MKTPIGFEYDLWTTGEGAEKKYWSRVKATGEISEISYEVMKFLRTEEKKIRREISQAADNGGSDLYLNTLSDNETGEFWLKDPRNFENELIHEIMLREFKKQLTDKQLSVFEECVLGKKGYTEYAKEHQISVPAVFKRIRFICDKANIFFGRVKN